MEMFRTMFMAELSKLELEAETTERILQAFDIASQGFDVAKKEVSMIVYGQAPELMRLYIGVKAVEGLSKGTLYGYKLDLEKFFSEMKCPVEMIKPNMIRTYLYNYQQTRAVSTTRLEKIRQCLSGFFNWAYEEGYIPSNPIRPVKRIKCPKRKRKSLTREQFSAMQRVCQTAKERAVLDLLFSTGCRVSEVCNMKRTDLDFTEMAGKVIGKGNKERTVYLNAAAKLSLRAYYSEREDDSPYVIVSTYAPHNKVSRESIGKTIKGIGERAGVPWVSPHIIRHTCATMAIKGGMPIQDVQLMLGHDKIETTMIYLDLDQDHVKAEHMRCVV